MMFVLSVFCVKRVGGKSLYPHHHIIGNSFLFYFHDFETWRRGIAKAFQGFSDIWQAPHVLLYTRTIIGVSCESSSITFGLSDDFV